MKAIKTLVFIWVCCIFLTLSCKKSLDFIAHGYNQPNAECLVTHLEDDLLELAFDITYNKNGDPATVVSEGYTSVMEYDEKKRLIRTSIAELNVRFEIKYKDNTFLPTAMYYYNPRFGGLIAIDSFKYNQKGEMIKWTNINVMDPSYNSSSIYEYDNNRNVKRVITGPDNGGTNLSASFVEYEVTKYDNQYNFISGNQWLKYILMHSGFEPYEFMQFSANNPLNWTWGDPSDSPLEITSEVKYNSKGFMNKVIMTFLYEGELAFDEWLPERLATSTCDIPGIKNRKNWVMTQNPFFKKRVGKQYHNKVPSPFSR